MTAKQARYIAAAIKRNRLFWKDDEKVQKVIDTLAVDIANMINESSSNFRRSEFLRDCDHPWFQEKPS